MLVVTVALALVWTLLTGQLTVPNLAFGLLLAWLVQRVTAYTAQRRRDVQRLPRLLRLGLTFLKELVTANLRVAAAVVLPTRRLRPGIVAVPVAAKSDEAVTLLANLITLTPGTLTVDVAEDRGVLYVHVMDLDDVDAFLRSLDEGLAGRVREVFET